MTRVRGLNKFILVILFLICMTSCKKSKFDIEQYDDVFLQRFSSKEDIKEREISDLNLYYYETYYYYDVSYYDAKRDNNYHLLYVLRYGGFDTYFSLKDEASAVEYNGSYYSKYQEAREKGESKIFTDEEIESLINGYYGL